MASRDGYRIAAGTDLPSPPAEVALRQTFDQDSLYGLRSAVAAHGADLGLPANRVSDMVIVAHELASNAVRHGGGSGQLRVWLLNDTVCCEVSDSGGGLADPAAAGRERVPAEALGGRGLWIIRQLSDTVTIRTGPHGSTITAGFLVDHTPARPVGRPPTSANRPVPPGVPPPPGGYRTLMTEYVSYPRPLNDPAADGIPEYADDDSTAFDDVDSSREADGPAALPADRESGPLGLEEFGTTAEEQRAGEPLADRLAREEPEVAAAGGSADAEPVGHLVRPDQGLTDDVDAEETASDAGFAGGGGSAEEQAMHIIDEP